VLEVIRHVVMYLLGSKLNMEVVFVNYIRVTIHRVIS